MKKETTIETLIEGKTYRVTNILTLVGLSKDGALYEALPLRDGFAIEEKEEDYYVVIAVLKWENNDVVFEDVDFRSINTLRDASEEKRDEYFNTIDFAKKALEEMNE